MSTVTAVLDAISIDSDGTRDSEVTVEFVVHICSNLVVVDESSNNFQFAHLSVVEYLQTRVIPKSDPPDKEYSFGHVSTEVAITCLASIAYAGNNDERAM
jgi:hypothetical protein